MAPYVHSGIRRLEQLDRVAGRVVQDDLPSARAGDHVAAEGHAGGAQPGDLGVDVVDQQVDAVPAAGSGRRPSGIGRPAELAGPDSSSRRLPRRTSANAGRNARVRGEAQVGGVEVDRGLDVVDQVADVDSAVGRCWS